MPENPVNLSSGLPETTLEPEPAEAREGLAAALAAPEELRRSAVAAVAVRWPRYLDAWARLGTLAADTAAGKAAAGTGSPSTGAPAEVAGITDTGAPAADGGPAADGAQSGSPAADGAHSGGPAAEYAEAYACYRVGYHRGLDQLRQAGWRGQGYVRWAHAPNRGFLRCLTGLARVADAIGEDDEARRCLTFIAQLDPVWDGTDG